MISPMEEAIRRVTIQGGEVFLTCTSKKNQESVRVILYRLKKKLLGDTKAEDVGISKIKEKNKYFIRVYKRPPSELYVRNSNGELELVKTSKVSPEIQRQINLMKADGFSEEKIEKILTEGGTNEA